MNFSKMLLGIVLGIAVYVILIIFSDLSVIRENFLKADLIYIFLGMGTVFLGIVARAHRWHLMLKFLDIKINKKSSYLLFFSGLAFGLTPGRLGEVIKSHYLKRLVHTPISVSAPTIIVERFLDVFAILTIALFAFLLTGTSHVVIPIGFFLIAVFLFLVYQRKILLKILKILESFPMIGKIFTKIIPSMDIIFKLMTPKIIFKILPLTIFLWIVEGLVVFFSLKSFGIDLSIIKSEFIFVISALIGSATLLPGGIGGTEGGLLGLFLLENISYNDAIGPILIIRVIVLWMTIIFGIFINQIVEHGILKDK